MKNMSMAVLAAVALIFHISAIVGCSTESKIQIAEQDRSLNDLRKAILAVIGEPRHLSENQREYYSLYFSRVPSDRFDPDNSRERVYTTVTILGDRRPYTVEVAVTIERKNGKLYKKFGEDKILAAQVRNEIKEKLAEGQDGVNVIDDFRAF